MLRVIFAGNSLPYSVPVDPNAEFQPGMAAQYTNFGNQIACGVSDGSAPFGVIDDIKTNAFSDVSIDEVVIGEVPNPTTVNNVSVTPYDVKVELDNPNIVESSFLSDPVDVELTARNGVVTFLAGTPLNYSTTGSLTNYDAIRTVVRYSYQVPNVPGDDSTLASNRVTVWFTRMIFITNQYETNQIYPINSPVFVNESGLWTTRQVDADYPAVGLVTGPPISISTGLEIMLL